MIILSFLLWEKLYLNLSFYQILIYIIEFFMLIYINRKFSIVTKFSPQYKAPLKEFLAGMNLIVVKIISILIFIGTFVTGITEFSLIEIFLFPGCGVYVLFYSYLYDMKIVTVADGIINLDDVEKINFNNGLLIQILELQLKNGDKKEIGISLDEYKRIMHRFNSN